MLMMGFMGSPRDVVRPRFSTETGAAQLARGTPVGPERVEQLGTNPSERRAQLLDQLALVGGAELELRAKRHHRLRADRGAASFELVGAHPDDRAVARFDRQ